MFSDSGKHQQLGLRLLFPVLLCQRHKSQAKAVRHSSRESPQDFVSPRTETVI
jgi:hypothetical protein